MFAAKISDHQFRAVLWQFVLDRSAREATKRVRLSENSIFAIYRKLRRFFFDLGIFSDPYDGADPIEGLPSGSELAEHELIDFHLKRVSAKRSRLDDKLGEPAYHLAESNWRTRYLRLRSERADHHVDAVMFGDLLEIIRLVGPIGRPMLTAQDRLAALRLMIKHQDRALLWLERNAAAFRDEAFRKQLRAIRDS